MLVYGGVLIWRYGAQGTVFSRAYVQEGVCSPSRNSFLSGRRPDTTKTWNFKGSFRDTLGNSASSWPGAFKNAGYTTVGLGKVYHPGAFSCSHPTPRLGPLQHPSCTDSFLKYVCVILYVFS